MFVLNVLIASLDASLRMQILFDQVVDMPHGMRLVTSGYQKSVTVWLHPLASGYTGTTPMSLSGSATGQGPSGDETEDETIRQADRRTNTTARDGKRHEWTFWLLGAVILLSWNGKLSFICRFVSPVLT